ncbi:MAG: hypothetical protein KBT53_11025 [Porticoccus sp.]|nr:hypothetical protein [Porticoccus sp.]MBQ0806963.1 hypothetical protein [Porticoccus sp.]
MRVVLSIQGSSDEPYEVVFEREGEVLIGSCTCRAAQFGQICKHRILLLSGDEIYLSGSDVVKVKEQLKALVEGSDLEVELGRISELSTMKTEVDRELKKCKKHMVELLNRDL